MALKPTIYKFTLALSDLEHDYFTELNLTVARHPSENSERMLARVLAFCLHAKDDSDGLMSFTKGISSADEPDIWRRSLDDQLQLWLDVGEPAFERLKKASRQAKQCFVYSFNSKSPVWWQQSSAQLSELKLHVRRFNWSQIQQLAAQIERTMEWSVTLSGHSIYVATATSQTEIEWQELQSAAG